MKTLYLDRSVEALPALNYAAPFETQANSFNELTRSVLDQSLFAPIQDLFERPSKRFRGKLVLAGCRLSDQHFNAAEDCTNSAHCEKLADVLEAIHAGSLVIDDIQDSSKERRGSPSLHERYGIPIALNAGNWLYFQPFEWIRKLELPEKSELQLYRLFHETMLNAHVGQAIDLGSKVDLIEQAEVPKLCESSARLKTGALMALALCSGAIVAGASETRLALLKNFGHKFGMVLQMFDDIGNYRLPSDHPKHLEDFKLRRPTWLWSLAAQLCTPTAYKDFVQTVRLLPNSSSLLEWMEKHDILAKAHAEAAAYLNFELKELEVQLNLRDEKPGEVHSTLRGLNDLHSFAEKVAKSYG